eukprot:2971730-Pyramimonas_sp.AAC.1
MRRVTGKGGGPLRQFSSSGGNLANNRAHLAWVIRGISHILSCLVLGGWYSVTIVLCSCRTSLCSCNAVLV